MSAWIKVITILPRHHKMLAANVSSPCDPLGLFVAALCASHEQKLNGRIPRHMLVSLRPGSTQTGVAARKLVEAGLWRETEDGWEIHDYLDHQQSAAEIEAEQAAARERQRRSRAKRVTQMSRVTDPTCHGDVMLQQSRAEQNKEDNNNVGPESDRAKARRDEEIVFAAWVEATGRTPQTSFDVKRRRAIQRALKETTLDDVLDAVRGARHSEHHMSNKQWSELRVVLRDMGQIEHFRDLERASHSQPARDSELVSLMPGNRQLEREAA